MPVSLVGAMERHSLRAIPGSMPQKADRILRINATEGWGKTQNGVDHVRPGSRALVGLLRCRTAQGAGGTGQPAEGTPLRGRSVFPDRRAGSRDGRSEEHTSELQS